MKIDLHLIEELAESFKNGVNLTVLSEQTGISKFRVRQALRKFLKEEYMFYVNQILRKKRSVETRKKMSVAAIKRNANPEWAKRVIETKRQRGYFAIHSKRHSEWMKIHHPTRGKKLSPLICAHLKTARQRFYDEGGIAGMKGKKHSDETKQKLREITKRMWVDGKFTYSSERGIWRSKLEMAVYNEFLKYDAHVRHSFHVTSSNHSYLFDIFVPSLNALIEVNGDYWHLNPNKYAPDYIDKHRNVTAQGVWDADFAKLNHASKLGFQTFTLWESTIYELGIEHCVQNIIHTMSIIPNRA